MIKKKEKKGSLITHRLYWPDKKGRLPFDGLDCVP